MEPVHIRGDVQVAYFRQLQRARELPFPTGRAAANKRAVIHRLEALGVVTVDGGVVRPVEGVPVRITRSLLSRLREGPLPSSEFRTVANSRASLRVMVNQARGLGHDIRARPDPAAAKTTGMPAVLYELVE